jgi:NTP pyrophosphatase (non-canonical NTP hydrolase)
MTLTQYPQEAIKTLGSKGLEIDLFHCYAGFTSEINELEDALLNNDLVNIKEELGDISWYVFVYLHLKNFDKYESIERLMRNSVQKEISDLDITFITRNLYRTSSNFGNCLKREVIYQKADALAEAKVLSSIFSCIALICEKYNIEYTEVLKNNIEKLKVRFPNKFTTEDALNRNLEEEYEKLSGN